jgi:hypothetical protein
MIYSFGNRELDNERNSVREAIKKAVDVGLWEGTFQIKSTNF